MPFIDHNAATPQAAGFPGQDMTPGQGSVVPLNNGAGVAQVSTLTVDSFSAALYQWTLDGEVQSYTAVAGDTNVTGVAKKIAGIINASKKPVAASYVAGVITVRSTIPGKAFTLTESDAKLSVASVTANAAGSILPFGRATVRAAADPEQAATISASIFTARARVLTPIVANNARYALLLVIEGDEYLIEFTSSGSASAQEIVEGLDAAVDAVAAIVERVVASEDDAALTLTGALGVAFELRLVTPNLTLTGATDGVTIEDVEVFVAVLHDQYTAPAADAVAGYPIGATAACARSNKRLGCATEAATVVGQPVYTRVEADGALDQLGVFRSDPAKGCVRIPGWRIHAKHSATYATIQI